MLVSQSCPTLCDPMDCSWPGSSVHGDSPGKNTGVGCYALNQGIFPTQGSKGLLHCRRILYHLSHQESPEWALSGSFPSLSFEDFTHLFWRSMDLDTHSKGQTYGTPSGDWYPEPSICMAWKLKFLGWVMGRWGAYAQITWGTLTMAIAQPGVVAELRHERPRHKGCCVTSSKCPPLGNWGAYSPREWIGLEDACTSLYPQQCPTPKLYLAIYVMPWRVCCLNVLLWLLPSLTFQNSGESFPLELCICLPS